MPLFDLNTIGGLLVFGQWLFKWDYKTALECYIKVGSITVVAKVTGEYRG